MTKPIFLWWAHKMMWDILARHPELDKLDAIEELQKLHPKVDTPLCSLCFACSSTHWYHGRCATECPLDWSPYDSCVCSSDALFSQWDMAKDAHDDTYAAKCAAQIRDLPLRKNARILYDVKEDSDE